MDIRLRSNTTVFERCPTWSGAPYNGSMLTNTASEVLYSRDHTLCDMYVAGAQQPNVDPSFI